MSVPESNDSHRRALVLTYLGRLSRELQFDRAVLYVVATKLWQLVAGPITAILIVRSLSAEQQGFYYAFGSLIAFQTIFDLNTSSVLMIAAGRHWGGVLIGADGGVTGNTQDISYLAGLVHFGQRWYRVAACCCFIVIGTGGWIFLHKQGLNPLDQLAWLVTILVSSFLLLYMPRIAILHGCHQVLSVNRNLTWQTITSNLLVWCGLLAAWGLWVVPLSWSVRLAWEMWLVHIRYSRFFRSIRAATAVSIDWKSELQPLQMRIAVHGISVSVVNSSVVLALMHRNSEAAAGRMGMTLSILNLLLWGGMAWVMTRVPHLSRYAKINDHSAFERIYSRITIVTSTAVAGGAFVGGLLFVLLDTWKIQVNGTQLTDRLVDPISFFALCGACWIQHVINCLTIYSRSRQREPHVKAIILFTCALLFGIWMLAEPYGELGVSLWVLACNIVIGLPLWIGIWVKERHTWGEDPDELSNALK